MMKKRTAMTIILLPFLLSSCLVGRFAWYNFSGITDYKIFPARALVKSDKPFLFTDAIRTDRIGKVSVQKLDSVVKSNNTVAFLVIRNDSVLFERYYQGYEAQSTVASFSMAKSYTSALIGAAVADGFIKSIDEPITNYITELKSKKDFDEVTIRHLLLMTSGIKANESYYNPFGQAARLYYGRNLRNYIKRLEMDHQPGTRFAYRSVNTQLLGLIVERATKRTVTDYMNDRIWKHLGAQYEADWSIDKKKNGLEKAFCCINAKARDFAKFGRLYLNKGNWNGTQVLPRDWVQESITSSNEHGAAKFYKYQWWLTQRGYEANGLHGQFIFVCPEKNLIVVRLGKSEGKLNWENLFDQLAEKIDF